MVKNKGFTLLEVLIALAIVGLVFGTVLSLLTGSKRLAYKASYDIGHIVFLRSSINMGQLEEEPELPELPEEYAKNREFEVLELVERDETKQTQPLRLGLEPYIVRDTERAVEIKTIRWKKLQSVH